MPQFVYIPGGNPFLAVRALRDLGQEVPLCLVAAAGAGQQAAEIGAAHCPGAEVVCLEQPDAAGRLAALLRGAATPEIVLPLALESPPLRHQRPLNAPDPRPYHALLRELWGLGFRGVRWVHLGGNLAMPLAQHLDAFVDRHKGRRCFVVGNGPSLNQLDMGLLKDEITLGANRGYLGFDSWGFSFTYWGLYDALQIEEYGAEYAAHVPSEIVKFYPLRYATLLQLAQGCPVHLDWPRAAAREFSVDPGRLIVGYSVTFMLLQVAALMGCDPIVLIGMDHRYQIARRPWLSRGVRLGGKWIARHFDHTPWYRAGEAAAHAWTATRADSAESRARIWEAGDAEGPTHFDSRYTSERKRFLMPRPQDAERDYACAQAWALREGRQIVNATPGTALDSFPKVDFDSFFR